MISQDSPNDAPWQPDFRPKWTVIVALAAVHGLAGMALLRGTPPGEAVVAWAGLAVATQLFGVSLGFHRLLAHRSFQTHRPMRIVLAVLGSLAMQGGPIWWVSMHRLHHRHPDTEQDLHSPRRGLLWAHAGWLLVQRPGFHGASDYAPWAGSVGKEAMMRWLDRWELALQAALWAGLYAVGGWTCLLWGGPIRLVCTWHATWLVSSAAHRWGTRRYETCDDARNCWWVALLTFGEGWHNNHHYAPYSARHGHTSWELDLGWLALRAMRRVGLVWGLRTPLKP